MGMATIFVMWPGPFEQTFVPLSQGGSIWNLASISLVVIEKKKFKNIEYERLGQRSVNHLDLWYSQSLMYSFSWLHLPTFVSWTTIVSEKSIVLTFFPYKSIGDRIWPCRKIGQGPLRVIIWTNLVVLEQPDAAYKLSRSSAFLFQRRQTFHVFTIYRHGGHLGHVTYIIWTNFHSPIPLRLHMKFGFNWPGGFSGKEVQKLKINDLDLWHSYRSMYSFS